MGSASVLAEVNCTDWLGHGDAGSGWWRANIHCCLLWAPGYKNGEPMLLLSSGWFSFPPTNITTTQLQRWSLNLLLYFLYSTWFKPNFPLHSFLLLLPSHLLLLCLFELPIQNKLSQFYMAWLMMASLWSYNIEWRSSLRLPVRQVQMLHLLSLHNNLCQFLYGMIDDCFSDRTI